MTQSQQYLMFIDRTSTPRNTFVELPDYVPRDVLATHVGKLRKAQYGTRPAAASWSDVSAASLSWELDRGAASVTTRHQLRGHCTVTTSSSLLDPVRKCSRLGRYSIKGGGNRDQLIGPESRNKKELHILNRTLRWCRDGLVFAADVMSPVVVDHTSENHADSQR